MNTPSSEPNPEPSWRTYLLAVLFALPPVVAWMMACVYLVPKAGQICQMAGLQPAVLGWVWSTSNFLVQHGQGIALGLIMVLGLLEIFMRGWARRRRLVVGLCVWLVNALVFFGLIAWLIVVLYAAPNLSHAK